MRTMLFIYALLIVRVSFAQTSCDSLFKLAGKAYNNQGAQQAIEVYNKIIAQHCSDSGHAYSNRGFMYNETEDYRKAIIDFEIAIRINPSDDNAYANESVAYNFLNEHDRAMACIQKAITLSPAFYQFYRLRGDVKYTQGKLDSAIADYKKSIELKPDYLELYTLIARMYEKMIRIAFDSADTKANNKAKPANPDEVGLQLTDFVHQARDSGEAILTLLINRFPANKLLIFNRAEFYRHNYMYDKAIPDYQQGLRHDSSDEELINNLALCYDGSGDWDSAIATYARSIAVKPNVLAYVNRGRLYKKMNKLQLSIADEENAIKIHPTFAQAYLIEGNCYLALKQISKAVTLYKKGLAQKPEGEIKYLLENQLAAAQGQ